MSSFRLLRQVGEQYQFLVSGWNHRQLNTFQQILMSQVPTLSISVVEVAINSSSLTDEQLAHAMGNIPFHSEDVASFPYLDECVVLEDCEVEYSLNVFCQHHPCNITAKMLQPVEETSVTPLYDDFLITILEPGQRIKLRCWVQKGQGVDHARFSPVSLSRFQELTEFVLNPRRFRGKSSTELRDILKICEENLLVTDPRTGLYRLRRPEELEKAGCPVSKLRQTDKGEFLFSFTSKEVLDLETLMDMAMELFSEETGLPKPELLLE